MDLRPLIGNGRGAIRCQRTPTGPKRVLDGARQRVHRVARDHASLGRLDGDGHELLRARNLGAYLGGACGDSDQIESRAYPAKIAVRGGEFVARRLDARRVEGIALHLFEVTLGVLDVLQAGLGHGGHLLIEQEGCETRR